MADGLKLLTKELIIPLRSNKYLFIISPVLFLSLSFTIWGIIPYEKYVVSTPNLGILVFLALFHYQYTVFIGWMDI